MKPSILTLAIETSCDETAVAVLENGRKVLANEIYTQVEIHKTFGGVVPEVASRNHLDKISGVIDMALKKSGKSLKEMDHLAVTYGPGLVGALLVGVATAKALAYALEKPLVPVNHIEGHIAANYIAHPQLEPPFTCLIVSGGHTHLVSVENYTAFKVLGRTRDDAAGEAFDKVARTLGLGYPGGPIVDNLSKVGNAESIRFPTAMLDQNHLDFSFSGLKSAVLNYINSCKMKNQPLEVEDICASFQKAVVMTLKGKVESALALTGHKKLVIAGGVAANSGLRTALNALENVDVFYPPLNLCTDNAAMIGCAGYYRFLSGARADLRLNAVPNLSIDQ